MNQNSLTKSRRKSHAKLWRKSKFLIQSQTKLQNRSFFYSLYLVSKFIIKIFSLFLLLTLLAVLIFYIYLKSTFSLDQTLSLLMIVKDPPPQEQITALLLQNDNQKILRTKIDQEVLSIKTQDLLTSLRSEMDADHYQAILKQLHFKFGYDFNFAILRLVVVDYQFTQAVLAGNKWEIFKSGVTQLKPQDLMIVIKLMRQSPVYDTDLDKADKLSKALFIFDANTQAQCTVALQNSTNISGLAKKVSNALEVYSIRVIQVQDGTKGESSVLVIDPDIKSQCQKVIDLTQAMMPLEVEVVEDKKRVLNHRSAILLVIGNEYEELFDLD